MSTPPFCSELGRINMNPPMLSAGHQNLEKGALLINMHKQTGQVCIIGHCKLRQCSPKQSPHYPFPKSQFCLRKQAFSPQSTGSGLLLNAALLMIWDIR